MSGSKGANDIILTHLEQTAACLQQELQRLEGIEQAERELALLQQAHALAIAQQEMARMASADQRDVVALHEQRLQEMHLAQVRPNDAMQICNAWLLIGLHGGS